MTSLRFYQTSLISLDKRIIPSPDESDTGLERLERFERNNDFPSLASLEKPMIEGPMGTPSNPTIVYSIYDSRIVGCKGDHHTREHDLKWHTVKREKPLVCMDCGQVFVLQTPPGLHRTQRHGHGDDHGYGGDHGHGKDEHHDHGKKEHHDHGKKEGSHDHGHGKDEHHDHGKKESAKKEGHSSH